MFKDRMMDLVEVRSIIAIIVAIAFVVLSFMGVIEPKLIEYVIISVFSFLFGTKAALDSPANINAPASIAPVVDPVMTETPAPKSEEGGTL